MKPGINGRVLALGVYLTDVENFAIPISNELASSKRWDIEQRWVALGERAPPPQLAELTALSRSGPASKFELLNRALEEHDASEYDYLLFIDDDIELPEEFVDTYFELVERHSLSLAQPARSHDSFIDHHFVTCIPGIDARTTRFVEIGPCFSVAQSAFPLMLPFDEAAPMGWGLDLVWPASIESAGLEMGIVDATSVRHALRKPASLYHDETSREGMRTFLASRHHIELDAAMASTRSFVGEESSWSPAEHQGAPEISVVLCTKNRASLLRMALAGLCAQTMEKSRFEVIVIDDGSTDETRSVAESFRELLVLTYAHQRSTGLAAGKNHGLSLSRAPIVFFADDDDVADPYLLEEHLRAHSRHPQLNAAVLGFTDLAPSVRRAPLMRYVTEEKGHLFSYRALEDGQTLGFEGFWGGRSSCKRMMLHTEGVFDPQFTFGAEDIELGYRLSRQGFFVIYNKQAASRMIRTIDFESFCARCYRQGQSNWEFARMHPDPEVQAWTRMDELESEWEEVEPRYEAIMRSAALMDRYAKNRTESGLELSEMDEHLLHHLYELAFRANLLKGSAQRRAQAAENDRS